MYLWFSHTCAISWMCKNSKLQHHTVLQNLKFISLDAGLRMDGLPALDLWDVVIDVLRSTQGIANSMDPAHGRPEQDQRSHPN